MSPTHSQSGLFTTKAVLQPSPGAGQNAFLLKRHLGAHNVFLIGAAGTIGAGIFVTAGAAAANYAGPAVILAFVIAGATSAFVGLCYSELAIAIPTIGSSYSYAFATGGELVAFVAGWTAIAQYVSIAATAATSLSTHVCKLVRLATGRQAGVTLTQIPFWYSSENGFYRNPESHGIVNLPAVAAVVLCSYAMCFGIKRSAHTSHVLIGIPLTVFFVLLLVIATGFDSYPHWSPFIPESDPDGEYGIRGVFHAASSLAFVYAGIDSAANCVQETKQPARDIAIGIIASTFFSTAIYALVYGGVLGVTPFKLLSSPTPLVIASFDIFRAMGWLVCIAAMTGLASAIIVSLIALPRILCSMAHDGLLGPMFGHIDCKSGAPIIPTLVCGAIIAVLAGFFPLVILGDLASAATLLTFIIVCVSACVLRFKQPDLDRPFRMPLGPMIVPLLGCAGSLGLLVFCGWENAVRLVVWECAGLVVYFGWSVRHSVLRTGEPAAYFVTDVRGTEMIGGAGGMAAAAKVEQGGEPVALRACDGK